jgi:hypothetical protein
MEPGSAFGYSKNEWAPVHESIAGPYIFVIGEGVLVKPAWSQDPTARGLCASALRYVRIVGGAPRLAAAYGLDGTLTLR